MTKVVVNGEIIILADELEKGEVELDLLQDEGKNENINLEDTIERRMKDINESK